MEISIVQNSKTINNDVLASLIDKNINTGLVNGYDKLIPSYKNLDSKQQKSVRKQFQGRYEINVSSLLNSDNKIDTLKCKDFSNSILKISETKGIFLLKGSERATFVCVDLNEIFPSVKPVNETVQTEVKEVKEVKKEVVKK